MSTLRFPKLVLASLALLLATLSLVGCFEEEKATLKIIGYNHTDMYIHRFAVNGYSASNLFEHAGGGKWACCVTIPRKYRPGLKATIEWETDDDKTYQRLVEIPPYGSDISSFNVHFLRDGNVKVFVTITGLGHPDYPLKGKEAEL